MCIVHCTVHVWCMYGAFRRFCMGQIVCCVYDPDTDGILKMSSNSMQYKVKKEKITASLYAIFIGSPFEHLGDIMIPSDDDDATSPKICCLVYSPGVIILHQSMKSSMVLYCISLAPKSRSLIAIRHSRMLMNL